MTRPNTLTLGAAAALALSGVAEAQFFPGFVKRVEQAETREVVSGTDLCACSPGSFQFTLDFGLTCPPVNIAIGDAVEQTHCSIGPFGDPDVTDLVPNSITSMNILELKLDSGVLAQHHVPGPLDDGDVIDYVSYVTDPVDGEIPDGLQLDIYAFNALGESISNTFTIRYSNDCSAYPVYEEGASAGWVHIAQTAAPPADSCPLAQSPTPMPTGASTPSITEPPFETSWDEPMSMSMYYSMSMSMSMDLSMSMDFSDVLDESFFGEERKRDDMGKGKGSKKSSKKSSKKGKGKGGKGDKKGKGKGGKGGKGDDGKGGKGGEGKGGKKGSAPPVDVETKAPKKSSKKGDTWGVAPQDDDAMVDTEGQKGGKRRRLRIHHVVD